MHKLLSIVLLLLSVSTIWMSAPTARAWQSSDVEIVVLTNHQTIQGIVQRQPEKFSVRLPSGSVIVLPESRVLLVGQTLNEVYWELAARTRSTDSKGQIDVYNWCVRNDLFDEAANHLLMLQEMDIPAKTLMQLDVSLQISKKRHLESLQKIAAAQTNPETVSPTQQTSNRGWQDDQTIEIPNLHDTAQTGASTNRLPAIDEFGNPIDGNVQLVSWDQPTSKNTQPNEPLIADQSLRRRLNATESLPYSVLDRLTRSMPKGAVGLFRKQVEPLLRRTCSNCHQSGSSDSAFVISQSHKGVINRRMSQKNLFQALNLADRTKPKESLLIRYATLAHGGQARPSFQWNDAKLNVVKQWLIMISDNPFLPLEQFAPDRDKEQPPRSKPLKTAGDTVFAKRLPERSPAAKPKPQKTADASTVPADPFDADTFNRKFGVR